MGFGKWARNFIIAGLTIPLAFCSSGEPRPTQTPVPTNTRPAPTATVRATPYPSPTYTPVPPTATPTPVPPTATPVQYLLTVQAFHDYNGNGTQDGGEPPLAGITNSTGRLSCTTGDDGRCELGRVPAGEYRLSIIPPTDSFLTYLSRNIREEIPLSRGMTIEVSGDTSLLLPLVEGPYRNPFPFETRFLVDDWVDIDREGCFRVEPGDRECPHRLTWRGNQATYDRHDGTDFRWNYPGIVDRQNVEVHAMRAGIVQEIVQLPDGEGWGILVRDKNPFACREGLSVPYHPNGLSYQAFFHLSEVYVQVGQEVDPTTLLGVGPSRTGVIHINQYICVPPGTHPASPYMANTFVPCPFLDHLWTSFGAFPEMFELYSPDGSLNGTITRLW